MGGCTTLKRLINMLQSTIKNRTIFCKDNLDILQGINSNTIDLIYLDPPFNKKKVFTAPIGSSAEGASFKDWFRLEDVKQEWVESIKEDNEKLHNFLLGIKNIDGRNSYNFCYVAYMAIRLIECHRILKRTGSLYLHCDQTMSHFLKITLDGIFGEHNFKNEIAWCYKSGGATKINFSKKYDNILFYTKSKHYHFNYMMEKSYGKKGGGHGGKVKYYTDETGDYSVVGIKNWWQIPILATTSDERTGYPTQKPLALLHRIIQASTDKDHMVLDPFCGCATTCIAAEQLRRKWIGIDISVKAYDLVRQRLETQVSDKNDMLKYQNQVHFRTDAPHRTDNGGQTQQQKYVYVISNSAYPNEYKVGVALNLKQRLNAYQTSDPNRGYDDEYSVLTPYYRELEKHIHNTFENKHEWVRADLQDIKDEINAYLKDK